MFQGELLRIFISPDRQAPMVELEQVQALTQLGLEGDRYALKRGTFSKQDRIRHVTLIELEALEALARDQRIALDALHSRRNLLTRGVPLNHLVGRTFAVGPVLLRGDALSEPCDLLEGSTTPGVRAALVHRGGLRAAILQGGLLRRGDLLRPAE
jgi:MOSC domain-containing protein YiiM